MVSVIYFDNFIIWVFAVSMKIKMFVYIEGFIFIDCFKVRFLVSILSRC